MTPCMFLLPICLALASPRGRSVGRYAIVPNCLLSLAEESQVPAQEAGVLMKIPVREGQHGGRPAICWPRSTMPNRARRRDVAQAS